MSKYVTHNFVRISIRMRVTRLVASVYVVTHYEFELELYSPGFRFMGEHDKVIVFESQDMVHIYFNIIIIVSVMILVALVNIIIAL